MINISLHFDRLIIIVLVQHHLLNLRNVNAFYLHVYWLSLDLQVLAIVCSDIVKERVVDRLADRHAFVWIELQWVQQEVFYVREEIAEDFVEWNSLFVAKGLNVVLGSLVADEVDVFWSTDDTENDGSKWGNFYNWSCTEWGKSLIFL